MSFKIISTYTSQDGEQDGILFRISEVNPEWEHKGILSHITTNLMRKGYLKDDQSVNIPNLIDLLNQANIIIKKESDNFSNFDTFFSGKIEFPSGKQQDIYIAQNETGRFTIMLPEDY